MRQRATLLLLSLLVCSVAAQQPSRPASTSGGSRSSVPPGIGGAPPGVPAPNSADAARINEVMAFERACDDAAVHGDVAFIQKAVAADFIMTHGDGWTTGGMPLKVDTKETWVQSVRRQPYTYRTLDSVQVELHGDVAITIGRYRMGTKANAPDSTTNHQYVWFERVYAKRNGEWQFLSHRTVNGPKRDEDFKSTGGR
jgi:hypothetical protein